MHRKSEIITSQNVIGPGVKYYNFTMFKQYDLRVYIMTQGSRQ